ncbi:hypothetical protein ACJX0J_020163, partial [Zea mays]
HNDSGRQYKEKVCLLIVIHNNSGRRYKEKVCLLIVITGCFILVISMYRAYTPARADEAHSFEETEQEEKEKQIILPIQLFDNICIKVLYFTILQLLLKYPRTLEWEASRAYKFGDLQSKMANMNIFWGGSYSVREVILQLENGCYLAAMFRFGMLGLLCPNNFLFCAYLRGKQIELFRT